MQQYSRLAFTQRMSFSYLIVSHVRGTRPTSLFGCVLPLAANTDIPHTPVQSAILEHSLAMNMFRHTYMLQLLAVQSLVFLSFCNMCMLRWRVTLNISNTVNFLFLVCLCMGQFHDLCNRPVYSPCNHSVYTTCTQWLHHANFYIWTVQMQPRSQASHAFVLRFAFSIIHRSGRETQKRGRPGNRASLDAQVSVFCTARHHHASVRHAICNKTSTTGSLATTSFCSNMQRQAIP